MKSHQPICHLALMTILLWAMGCDLPGQTVINNSHLRAGNGMENSINTSGNLRQPHYHNGSLWRKLTYSTLPLNMSFAAGGDGANYWNLNGTRLDDPLMFNQVVDYSNFTYHNGTGGAGCGTVTSTGDIVLDGKTLTSIITYELLPTKSYIKITVHVKNNAPDLTENLRVWVGTRDDWVGQSDEPTKQRGNLVNGTFQTIPTYATPAAAVRITSGSEEVMFFTDSPKATAIIQTCCQWTNVINQNPELTSINQTGDGSYGFYVRLNDLEPGESDEFSWYYAVGPVDGLEEITDHFSQGIFNVNEVACTYAHFDAKVATAGVGYYVAVPQGSAVPSTDQIIAGVNYDGVEVASAGNAPLTADSVTAFFVEALAHSTEYTFHFVQQGVHPQFAAATSINFSTLSPPVISFTSAASTTCADGGDGSITAQGTGGTEPYAFIWSTGETGEMLSGKSAGYYNVLMHDAGGCPEVSGGAAIALNDQTLPVSITKDITVYLDQLGRASISAADIDDGSTDDCGIATLDVSQSFFNCDSDPFGETVTLTVTDLSGNQHTATSQVTIIDSIAPTARGRNITVGLDDAGQAEIAWQEVEDGSSDNCAIAEYILSQTTFDCSNVGDNLVNYTVVDSHGNTDTASIIVTVGDDSAPVMSCGALLKTCAGIYDYLEVIEAYDNCSFTLEQEMGPERGSYVHSGEYFVQFIATDAAGNSTTCSTVLQVIDAPKVDLGPDLSINAGDKVVLTVDSCAGCSYHWSTGERTPTITVEPIETQKIKVSVRNEAGCESTSELLISLNAQAGLPSQPLPDGFRLYPNPAVDVVKLEFNLNHPLRGAQLTITDIQGKTMRSEQLNTIENGELMPVNVSNLSSGLYVLMIRSELRSYTAKFAKR